MSIKQLEPTDTLLFPSFFECLNALSPSPMIDEARVSKILTTMQQQQKLVFVFVIDKEVGGTLSVMFEQKLMRNGSRCAHLEDVATHPKHQHKGIASKMIAYACAFAQEKGCYKMVLTCRDYLVSLYERNSFKTKGIQMEARWL